MKKISNLIIGIILILLGIMIITSTVSAEEKLDSFDFITHIKPVVRFKDSEGITWEHNYNIMIKKVYQYGEWYPILPNPQPAGDPIDSFKRYYIPLINEVNNDTLQIQLGIIKYKE